MSFFLVHPVCVRADGAVVPVSSSLVLSLLR